MLPRRRRHVALLLALACLAAPAAANPSEEAARAEELVRARYHEGFPPEFAAEIGRAGAAHLAALLESEAHAPFHATIIEALGLSGHRQAVPALLAYAEREHGEALDPARFRAWRALPMALGRLASRDDRALRWLIETAAETGPTAFRAGPHGRDELGARRRRLALYGLGVSGRPAALPALRAAAAGAPGRARRAAETALTLHAEEAGR